MMRKPFRCFVMLLAVVLFVCAHPVGAQQDAAEVEASGSRARAELEQSPTPVLDPIPYGETATTTPGAGLEEEGDAQLSDEEDNVVLWDQPFSLLHVMYAACQDFETENDVYDIFVADDFANTEVWTINTIYVPGVINRLQGDLLCADHLNFAIYRDASGTPDGYPDGGLGGWGNAPVWQVSLAPDDSQITLEVGAYGGLTNTTLNLTRGVRLTPGTYWLVFWPEMSFTVCGFQFYRLFSGTTRGYDGQAVCPGGGMLYTPPSWGSARENWPITVQDFAFRLEGQKGASGIPTGIFPILLKDEE